MRRAVLAMVVGASLGVVLTCGAGEELPAVDLAPAPQAGWEFEVGIYGFLAGKDPQWAVDCGAAHGALAMTTPGDTTMARLTEVERVMTGGSARVAR